MIEVENLGKNYGSLQAVRNVSFKIEAGEVVGLLGPNGAGKTTIMRILTGYIFPTYGNARINGFDIFNQALAVKESIGYLPENAPLYTDLNVMEYLDFIAESHSLSPGNKKQRIEWVIDECGLGKVIYRNIARISRGYKQRAALAQAIIHNPQILIFDEPTIGLDPNQIIEIRELIKGLGREKTVILSTHILQEVEASCGRVMILNEGEIVAQGTTEEIWREMKGEIRLSLTLKGIGLRSDVLGSKEAEEDLRKLAGVKDIINWRALPPDRYTVQLFLDPDSGGAAEEAVFDWAVRQEFKILSMIPQRLSLEDIFIKLTKESVKNVS